MALIGIDNASGGVTTIDRVLPNAKALLERADGFDIADGTLTPARTIQEVTTGSALSGTTPEQVPVAFELDGNIRIIARDSTEALREHLNGVWSSAGTVIDILPESTPARFGEQLIIPSGGYHSKLMAYEPGSTSTKIRPFSLMAPGDYKGSAKIVVAVSTNSSFRLFDCEDGNVWVAGTGWTVDNTGTDVCINTLTPTAHTAGTKIMSKSLGSTGIEAQGKEWFILDIMLQDDPQNYNYGGLFVNDPYMQGSGYQLVIYSDTACTTALATWHIPKITPEGKINRMAFKMPVYGTSQKIKGIAILSASFWLDPAVATKISIYSETDTGVETAKDDWSQKGNFLVPAIVYNISPLAQQFETVQDAGARKYETPPPTNLITEPGFETEALWTLGNYASTKGNGDWDMPKQGAHGGVRALKLDNYGITLPEYAEPTADIAVTGGAEYKWELWNLCPWNPAKQETDHYKWHIEITFNGGGTAARFPATGEYTPGQQGWKEYTGQFTVPTVSTLITSFRITCESTIFRMRDMMFDDVGLYKLDQTADSSVYVIQTFTPAGTEWEPDKPRIKYRYAFMGRDILSKDNYKPMISNPSAWDTETNCTYADPFRTYALSITLPGGKSAIKSVASAPTAAGTGYTVGDVLTVTGGTGGTVTVATITGGGGTGPVGTVTLTTAGSGYTEGAGAPTTGGTGTGCTVNISTSNARDFYANYLTHVLIYRQVYDGLTKTWTAGRDATTGELLPGEDKLIAIVEIGTTGAITCTDAGNDTLPEWNSFELPKESEVGNDYLGAARYVMAADGRPYAGCLDWPDTNGAAQTVTFTHGTETVNCTAHGYVNDTKLRFSVSGAGILPAALTAGTPYFVINATANTYQVATGKGGTAVSLSDNGTAPITATPVGWQLKTAIAVGNWDKPWAFPTTNDENSTPVEGTLLFVPTVTGSEIRGMVARNEEKYIFMDNEFFLLQGNNPVSGYRFIRIAAIGCISNRSLSQAKGGLIWHDSNEFYYYGGGQPDAISRYQIDSTLIDWDLAHNAVFRGTEYIFYCKYNSEYALLIFDIDTGAWRIRRSAGLALVGICTDGQDVYGVTAAGDVVNLFSGIDGQNEFGAGESAGASREAFSQYIQLCSPEYDVQINHAVVEAVLGYAAGTATFNASTDEVTLTAHGYVTGTQVKFSLDSTGVIPDGLAVETVYHVIFVDANTFRVATTHANAVAGTSINITSAGTATITCTPQAELSIVFNTQGKLDATLTRTVDVVAAQTRYPDIGLNLQGNAVQMRATYDGVTPPTILSMGVITDKVPVA